MSSWQSVYGIGVSAELEVAVQRRGFVMLGERWFGDLTSTVLGVGYRL